MGSSQSRDDRNARLAAMALPDRWNAKHSTYAPLLLTVPKKARANEATYLHLVSTPPSLAKAAASFQRCVDVGLTAPFDVRRSTTKAVSKAQAVQLGAVLPTTLRAACALRLSAFAVNLIKYGSATKRDPQLGTCLHTALRFASPTDDATVLDTLRAVLKMHPSDVVERGAESPSSRATGGDWIVDARIPDAFGNHILHLACFKGLRKTVQYLATPRAAGGGGGDLAAENVWGENAFDVASERKYIHVANDLAERGAIRGSVSQRAYDAEEARQKAATERKRVAAVDAKRKKDEAAGPGSGRALYTAIKSRNDAKAQQLLKLRADVHFADGKTGFTSLHVAALTGNVKVMARLMKRGVKADVKAKNGMVPLHMACHNGHEAATLVLLRAGPLAMRAARDVTDGRCPADLAMERGFTALARTVFCFGDVPEVAEEDEEAGEKGEKEEAEGALPSKPTLPVKPTAPVAAEADPSPPVRPSSAPTLPAIKSATAPATPKPSAPQPGTIASASPLVLPAL
jgi:ankyrin repeat protein